MDMSVADKLVKCKICGKRFRMITAFHLKHVHGITMNEYRQEYPGAPIWSDRRKKLQAEKMSGPNNPAKRADVKNKMRKPRPHMCGPNNPNYGRRYSEEERIRISERKLQWVKENPDKVLRGNDHGMYGRQQTVETREKMRGPRPHTCGPNNPGYGIPCTDEHKEMMSRRFSGENNPFFGGHHTEETRKKMRGPRPHTMGRTYTHTEEAKEKMKGPRPHMRGVNNPAWKNGASFEPYCPKFSHRLKEEIRNQYGRTCANCGKSEIENGERLSVHHVDGNKMQGCDGHDWFLVPLCRSCHNSKFEGLKLEDNPFHIILFGLKRLEIRV